MTAKRINRAGRRYLLTGKAEPYAWPYGTSGGRWAVQRPTTGHAWRSVPTVHHFETPWARDEWVRRDSKHRRAVGVRHPLVKAYRDERRGQGMRPGAMV